MSPIKAQPAPQSAQDQRTRTAAEIIDQAIDDNKRGERLLYILASALLVAGLIVLFWAMFHRESLFAVLGTLTSSLLWPVIKSVRQTKDESVLLRLLEVSISLAPTEKAAAEIILRLFYEHFADKKQDGELSRKRAKIKGIAQ